jgi:hypothetical protein
MLTLYSSLATSTVCCCFTKAYKAIYLTVTSKTVAAVQYPTLLQYTVLKC